MYEKNLERNLVRIKIYAGVSLCVDFLASYLGISSADLLVCFVGLVYPIVESNGSFSVMLYLISQFQAWHLTLPQYVMKGRRADMEFLCYASLFFVITLHPFSKFVHLILFFYFYFWTKIRYSDTLGSISSKGVKNNFFVR